MISALILSALGGIPGIATIVVPELGIPRTSGFLVIALIAALCACGGLIKANWQLLGEQQPALKFSCGPKVDGSVEDPPNPLEYRFMGRIHRNKGRYLRVRIETVTSTSVNVPDCTGHLTGIYFGKVSVFPPNNVRLTFQPGSDNQPPRTITSSKPEFLDVLRISEHNQLMVCAWNNLWEYKSPQEIFSEIGIYNLTVTIETHNKSHLLTLEFDWKGTWSDSTLTLINSI